MNETINPQENTQPQPITNQTPPPPQTTQTETVAPQPTKKKNIPAIVLSILLVLALGVAGYFAYTYYQHQIPSITLTDTINPTPSPSPTSSLIPTPNPTTNWKTYTNNTEGFSIKYPPDYTYQEINDLGPQSFRVNFSNSSETISAFQITTTPANIPEYPNDLPPTGSYSLGEYSGIYQELPEGSPMSPKDESINPPQLHINLQLSTKTLGIRFLGIANIKNETASAILTSLQFKNQNNYQNQSLNFSLNIPEYWKYYTIESNKAVTFVYDPVVEEPDTPHAGDIFTIYRLTLDEYNDKYNNDRELGIIDEMFKSRCKIITKDNQYIYCAIFQRIVQDYQNSTNIKNTSKMVKDYQSILSTLEINQ